MRIAVTIDHEFDSLELFADFSAKLKDLFHQFGYNSGAAVRVVETSVAAAPAKRVAPAPVSTAIEETTAELAQTLDVGAHEPLPVVHDLPTAAPAPATSVPDTGTKKRVRRTKAQIAADNAAKIMGVAPVSAPVVPVEVPAVKVAPPIVAAPVASALAVPVAAVVEAEPLVQPVAFPTATPKPSLADDFDLLAASPALVAPKAPAAATTSAPTPPADASGEWLTPQFTKFFGEALKLIGPPKMGALMAQRGYKGLHQIPADKRPDFVALLKSEMAKLQPK